VKRKTWQRLWGEINKIPFGKIKKIYGKDYAEKFKNLVLEYCLCVFYTQNKRTEILSYDEYLYFYNVQNSINPLDGGMKVNIWYSGKDGIHFKLVFETYNLDYLYSEYLEEREENERISKEQKQQFKYAARYYKGK
jgi:hypothetical protein